MQQIEEKFEAKKRKFTESSESFQAELKKHCKRAVEDETFQELVDKQYEILWREYEERQKNSPLPPTLVAEVVAGILETDTIEIKVLKKIHSLLNIKKLT